jgi:DHA1 family bicyclomycin/chloramphenicol resistance-like MFS transporter
MSLTSKSALVPGWLLLIGAMTALGPVSIDMYLPGFLMIEADFGQQGVEHTMATYLIGLALGQLAYGPISDRFGRKPPLYVGFALYTLGSFGCALSESMGWLMALRVLQALGGCGGVVIGRAIVRDRCEPHEAARAFSTLMLIVALGPVIAPVVGGWVVTAYGWRAVFVIQGLLGIVLMIAMHHVLQETHSTDSTTPFKLNNVIKGYVRLISDVRLIGYALIGGLAMGAMFCYVTGFPTVMTQDYGLSPSQFSLLIGLNGLAFMVASRWNIVALRRVGPAEVLAHYVWVPLVFGATLMLLSYITTLPLWAIVSLQLAFFVIMGRVNPNVAALALAPHGKDAGAASALMGSMQSAISMVFGAAVAAFDDVTIFALASLMTAGALGCWLAYVWVKRRERLRG